MAKKDITDKALYETALKIGTSLQLYEMLKIALGAYVKMLKCSTGIVCRVYPSGNGYQTEMIFSIPYAIIVKEDFRKMEKLVPAGFTAREWTDFKQKLPLIDRYSSDQFYHIMELENFGLILFITDGKVIDREDLEKLDGVNRKLAVAGTACIIHEQLRESENRYRVKQELLPEMMFETDMNGIVTYTNNFTMDKIGISEDDISKGFNILNTIHRDDRKLFRKLIEDKPHSGKVNPVELRVMKKDGSSFPAMIYANYLKKNREYAGLIGFITDITEIQKNYRQQELLSEIALELNSLEDFSTRINTILKNIGLHTGVSRTYIFEDSADGLVTNNTYEWCNKDIKPHIEVLQRIPYEIIPSWKKLLFEKGMVYSENISRLPADLRGLLEPQGTKSIIVFPLYVKGSFFGFTGFDECVRYKKWDRSEIELLKTISGIIANAYERKVMEQSIIEERDRAQDANRAKSEFLANMSHEIRTPMNAILGFSEVLYNKLENSQHRKMIKSILSSGNLLLALLNDILDLSKIEAGKMLIVEQPVDLTNILNEINMMFSEKASLKGIEIKNSFEKLPSKLMLDEIRIKQVLFNLVGNAIKFTHEGYVKTSIIYKPAENKHGTLTIEVEDTGIGIPGEQQEKIFEAFEQQSGQSNRMFGGVGLGLAISKRLVEKMNGRISVDSKEGKGSVFRVILPGIIAGDDEPARKEQISTGSRIRFEKAEILVVDDIKSNIEIIETMLTPTNIRVTSAKNAEIAMEILEHLRPDLILLDLRMPGIDGYQMAERVKSKKQLSDIPLIAFTASVFSTEKIKDTGHFADILMKPVKQYELLTVLRNYLKHSIIDEGKKATKKTGTAKEEEFPGHIIKALPEIKKEIRSSLIPLWEDIKDQLVLFRIEEFSTKLKLISEKYKFSYLESYADRIMTDLENVDLEALRETINEFPRITRRIFLYQINI